MNTALSPSTVCAIAPTYIDPILDEEAAGVYLGGSSRPVSARTLQRWRLEAAGPVWIKLGRLVRYRKSALDAFLVAGTRSSTSQAA